MLNSLTESQKQSLSDFKYQVLLMDEETCKEKLISLCQQLMILDNKYKAEIKKQWGMSNE